MISACEKGIRHKRGRRVALVVATISRPFLPPFFLCPLYTRCPIERNLWKSVPQSCLADFRGRTGERPQASTSSTMASPPSPLPQQFLIPSTFGGLRERKDRERKRPSLPGRVRGGALIPAARFRSQFSRALTRPLCPLVLFRRRSASPSSGEAAEESPESTAESAF